MARFIALALLASSALAVHARSTPTASELVARAFEPALNALFPRHAVLKRDSGDISQIESEVADLAAQAADQVATNGTCATSSTCGGWVDLAESCASNSSQALCICGSDAISAATACADCLNTSTSKSEASDFSSFCSAAVSSLSASSASTSATGAATSSSASASSTSSPESNSGAAGTLFISAGPLAGVVGAAVAMLAF